MNRHYPEAYMDVAHTALLLIDIQNDFCHTNGVAGLNGKSMAMMDGMLSHSSRLLQAARKAGVLVVHVQHTVLPIGGSDAQHGAISCLRCRQTAKLWCKALGVTASWMR